MIRLISFIVIFAVFLVFIVFNLNNKCDISFGFTTAKDIPIFLSALFSFVLGMLFTIPLVFSMGRKRKKGGRPGTSGGPKPSGLKIKRLGFKSKKTPQGAPSEIEEIKKENGPYGID